MDHYWRSTGNGQKPEVEVEYLVEPLGDGAIFQAQAGGIKKLPFTLKSLVHFEPGALEGEWREGAVLIVSGSRVFCVGFDERTVRRRQFKESGEEPLMRDGDIIAPLERLRYWWEELITTCKDSMKEPLKLTGNCPDPIQDSAPGRDKLFRFRSVLHDLQWSFGIEAALGSQIRVACPANIQAGYDDARIYHSARGELKGSSVSGDNHVLFDKNKATFYFDDLVNVGRLRRNSTKQERGTLFVLPQSHYPILEKKPRNALGNNKEGGELILSGGHQFLSVQGWRGSRFHSQWNC